MRRYADGSVTAEPELERFDPSARLVGLRIAGRSYDGDAGGVHAVEEVEAG